MAETRTTRSSIITTNTYVSRDDVFYVYAGMPVTLDVQANDDRPAGELVATDFSLATPNSDGTLTVDLTSEVFSPSLSGTNRSYSFTYWYPNHGGFVSQTSANVDLNLLFGTPGLGGSGHVYGIGLTSTAQASFSFNALDFIDPARTGTTLSLSSATLDGSGYAASIAPDGTVTFDPRQFHAIDYDKDFVIGVEATNAAGQTAVNEFSILIKANLNTGGTFSTAQNNNIAIGTGNADELYATNAGSDILAGGLGADTFYFSNSQNDGFAATDVILDFDIAGDRVVFEQATELVAMLEVFDGVALIHDGGNDMLAVHGAGLRIDLLNMNGFYVAEENTASAPDTRSPDQIADDLAWDAFWVTQYPYVFPFLF